VNESEGKLQMKYLLSVLVLVSVSAFGASSAQEVSLLYDTEATIQFLKAGAAGSYDKIEVDGKDYVLVAMGKASRDALEDLRNNYAFQKLTIVNPRRVVGFTVHEKGHMPNRAAAMDVFYLLSYEADFVKRMPKK
jgi:hypothetical protein